MSSPRVAHALFCDDIRMEIGNKPSFMGIYSGEIVFLAGPPGAQIILPKFAIISWLICDIDDKPERLTVRVRMQPGAEILKFEAPYEPDAPHTFNFDDATKYIFTIPLPIINFAIPGEGILEVTIETERETLRAGRLRVRIQQEPEDSRADLDPDAFNPFPTA
jgi:hypothetical protein